MLSKKIKKLLHSKNPYKISTVFLTFISIILVAVTSWIYYSSNNRECLELANCPRPAPNQNTSTIQECTDSEPNAVISDVLEKFSLIIPRNNIPQESSIEVTLSPFSSGYFKHPENQYYIDSIKSEVIALKSSGYPTNVNGDPVEIHYDLSEDYTELYFGHSKIEEASFYKIPDEGDPIKLDTTFDKENQKIVSLLDYSEVAGNFGVLAPYKCAGHPDEPSNNRYEQFIYGIPEDKEVFNNESDYTFGEQIEQYFDVKSDQDWFNIILKEGKKYTIDAKGESEDVIPFISIYGGNIEEIASKRSYIELDPADEPYLEGDRLIWIKLEPTSNSSIDCDSKYTLVVNEVDK